MYIFLDESGDLGFDFDNKQPSRFFIITLLAISNVRAAKHMSMAVHKTLSRKINHKKKKRIEAELKGTNTRIDVKKYFLRQLNKHYDGWRIYSVVLDKRKFLKHHKINKERIYNHMSYQLLEKVNFQNSPVVNLIIDRSKDKPGVCEFNDYISSNLNLCLGLETRLYLTHENSVNQKGIQAADIFCYGIAKKYEHNDSLWYNCYKEKIMVEHKFTW